MKHSVGGEEPKPIELQDRRITGSPTIDSEIHQVM